MVRLFNEGGPFMWLLLAWSIGVLGFALERFFTYWRTRSEDGISRVTSDLIAQVESGAGTEELEGGCEALGRLEGAALGAGCDRYRHLSTEQRSLEEMRQELNATVERASVSYLERYLPVIAFVASSSVLLGLLGTVRGMIVAFRGIAEKGLGEPTIVAAGISEALITTVTGLVIAIPAIAIHSYFAAKAQTKAIQFEPYGHLFVDSLLRRWASGKASEA